MTVVEGEIVRILRFEHIWWDREVQEYTSAFVEVYEDGVVNIKKDNSLDLLAFSKDEWLDVLDFVKEEWGETEEVSDAETVAELPSA